MLQDTDAFGRTRLCDPPVVEYVNTHFVSWGGDIRNSDAYMVGLEGCGGDPVAGHCWLGFGVWTLEGVFR